MRKRILTAAVAAATLASGAQAAGFYLKEQSVVGQGRAFAGSAAGTDGASAAYFNPAGIVGVEEQVEVGVHYIKPDVKVTNNGSESDAIGALSIAADALVEGNNSIKPYDGKAVPNFHYVRPIDDSTAFGLAIGAPYGFSNDYGNDSFTRLDNIRVDLSVIEMTASLAKKVTDKLNVSVGLVHQDLEVEQDVATATGNAKQTGKGTEIGYSVALQYFPNEKTTLGASYRSATSVRTTGTLDGGPYDNAAYEADFDLPSIFALGLEHKLSNQTKAYADVTYYGWSVYEKLVAIATAPTTVGSTAKNTGDVLNSADNNYSDTVSWAVGLEHDYGDGLTVRSGIHVDPTPTNDTDRSTTTPDSDRTWLAFGLSKELNEALTFDAAFTHIMADDGKINKVKVTSSALGTDATIRANVKSSTNIVSLGFRYKF